MSFKKSYEEARASYRPMKRGQMNRSSRIKPRFSKKASVDGDSERAIRDDCDEIVRQILRLRDSVCITCPETEGLQVGHLFKRGKHRVRWNLLNCSGQCPRCNKRHNDEPEHYIEAFLQKHGEAAYNALRIESRSGAILTYVELLAIRDGLRAELGRLRRSGCPTPTSI